MEWVETTGKSVEEALDVALDQLGVDEAEAEYEVLGEPKVGLFGRLRAEARIRARVRPAAAPSKEGANNNRRRRSNRNDRGDRGGRSKGTAVTPRAPREETEAKVAGDTEEEPRSGAPRNSGSRNRRKPATTRQGAADVAEEEIPLTRQGEVATDFLSGLLREIQAPVDISVAIQDDDEIVSLSVEGDNLGHLIGPRGATLHSLQEITRTVVQRQTGARNGRIIVDVGRYREKRREALERFTKQVAEEILASGGQRGLEPMNPSDRKVVHDTVNAIDGISTTSEGEEPRRYVVIKSDTTDEVG
jgi:spoIIIJ-associated protein